MPARGTSCSSEACRLVGHAVHVQGALIVCKCCLYERLRAYRSKFVYFQYNRPGNIIDSGSYMKVVRRGGMCILM